MIGLLGGSYNPAHAGHQHVAQACRRALGLDVVWLMVSPGNPLKDPATLAPFSVRLASAQSIADGRRILATGIEQTLHTRYTIDTLRALRRRFPTTRFVFLMGADAFAQLHRWKAWRRLVHLVPIAVHARPGADRAALSSRAAHLLRHRRVSPARLAATKPPAWCFLPLAHHPASATALRAQARLRGQAGARHNASP